MPLRLTFAKYKEIFLENKIIFMENSWILLQFLSENWIATVPNDISIYVKIWSWVILSDTVRLLSDFIFISNCISYIFTTFTSAISQYDQHWSIKGKFRGSILQFSFVVLLLSTSSFAFMLHLEQIWFPGILLKIFNFCILSASPMKFPLSLLLLHFSVYP